MEDKNNSEILNESPSYELTRRIISNDRRSFIFAFLGFLSAIWGFILYLIYEDRKPLRAASLKTGIIVGIIFKIVLIVVFVIATTMLINNAASAASGFTGMTI